MITKSLKKYQSLIQNKNHVWTKGEIKALAKAIRAARWEKDEESKEFRLRLLDSLWDKSFKITKDQSDFGKSFLKTQLFKCNGQLRKSKVAIQFGEERAAIVKKLKRFTFDGFHVYLNPADSSVSDLVPVYTAYDSQGNKFSYAWVHWGPVLLDSDLYMNTRC